MAGLRRVLPCLLLVIVATGAACRDEDGIRLSGLDLEGVEQVDEGELRNALATQRGSWLPWGRQRQFDRQAFEADLQRIEAFYRDRGFPDARVTSFDLSLSDRQDEISVTLHISEGEPIQVADIELRGIDVLRDRLVRELRAALPLQPDRPFDRQLVIASRERVLNLLRDEGYPYATVEVTDEEVGPRARRVIYEATPGLRATFGPIEIAGAASVDENVIRRQLTFGPSDLFMRREMRESQRKLYRLELFQFVNVESLEDPEQPTPAVPTRVTVAEADHQRVTFGLGYGSEEQARVRLRWDHVNFLGGARHAGFEGKWSSLDRGVRLDFREPYFLLPYFGLDFEGRAWQASEPVYSVNSLGGRLGLRHQGSQNNWLVSFINEYQRSTIAPEALEDFDIRDRLIGLGLDPRTGIAEGTVTAVAFDIGRTTVDRPLDSSRGYALSGRVEKAGQWMWGTYSYLAVTAEGRHYLPIGRSIVVANRLRAGAIRPDGGDPENVPFHKRYFLGGSSSVRGWGRFEVSPLSGFGLTIGGHTMLEASSEVRFPVWGSLGAVAFVDAGNVWPDAWDFKPGDLRYAVGPGLRYRTPIGPVRFDLGYQVNPLEGLRVKGEPQGRRWRVHFSVGQAF